MPGRLVSALALGLVLALLAPAWLANAQARQEQIVYFEGSPYELNIYKIFGEEKGPTLMIIGGIQGNEPGGFLSADLYADFALEKGNLIVVPRANFNSILLFERGPGGDMNRMFGPATGNGHEQEIVRILKALISQSDYLLNLHDGWGFYRPSYESPSYNPDRFGQSIIADCARYYSARLGRELNLEGMAEKVIGQINAQIDDPRYHFHFMNTRTADEGSPYTEQRSSATFYALTTHGIPAFGVETSKNLPSIEMKVRQHNLAINAFMDLFGLKPQQPRIYLVPPRLKYLIVSVNDQVPIAVADGQTLEVARGDRVEVIHIESNYERGLSCDIAGVGDINDFRQALVIEKPTFIISRKDHIKFGRVLVSLGPASKSPAAGAATGGPPGRVSHFLVEVEGVSRVVEPGTRLTAHDGDRIRLVDVFCAGGVLEDGAVINFKGFVPPVKGRNDGQDRGWLIDTRRQLMQRYSLSKTGKLYRVNVEKGPRVLAWMEIELKKPALDYLVVQIPGGIKRCLANGETLALNGGQSLRILDIDTNLTLANRLDIRLEGGPAQRFSPALDITPRHEKARQTLLIERDGLVLGRIYLNLG